KIPEPMMAPMPRAVRDQGPRVFFRRCSGASASATSLSMLLQRRSCEVTGCRRRAGEERPWRGELALQLKRTPPPCFFARVSFQGSYFLPLDKNVIPKGLGNASRAGRYWHNAQIRRELVR